MCAGDTNAATIASLGMYLLDSFSSLWALAMVVINVAVATASQETRRVLELLLFIRPFGMWVADVDSDLNAFGLLMSPDKWNQQPASGTLGL